MMIIDFPRLMVLAAASGALLPRFSDVGPFMIAYLQYWQSRPDSALCTMRFHLTR
jgi:hypothetical protein